MSVSSVVEPAVPARDALWEDARNSLGIARLLVHEARPQFLVGTACRMAVEAACRAALEHEGVRFAGDPDGSLRRLGAPDGLWPELVGCQGRDQLAAAERAVGWVATYLRGAAPGRRWGY